MSNDNESKSVFDKFFDAADSVLSPIEKMVSPSEGLWRVDEVLDRHGTAYIITDGNSKLETDDNKLAQRVCDALNG